MRLLTLRSASGIWPYVALVIVRVLRVSAEALKASGDMYVMGMFKKRISDRFPGKLFAGTDFMLLSCRRNI